MNNFVVKCITMLCNNPHHRDYYVFIALAQLQVLICHYISISLDSRLGALLCTKLITSDKQRCR